MFKSSKRLIAILICLAMVLAALPMAVFAADTTTIYLKPSTNWQDANAWFAAWLYDGTTSSDSWATLTAVEGEDGLYSFDLPEGSDYTGIIFVRMNPDVSQPSWNDNEKWAQTENLTLPAAGDDKVVFAFNGTDWDTTGEWIVKGGEAAPVVKKYYLRGTMNEWAADDATNLMTETGSNTGIYTISMELAAGTYQYKAATENWSAEWPSSNAELVLNEAATVTFTLNTNDRTITATVPDTQLVKAQVNTESNSLRLLASVDDLESYASVSFNVTINGNTTTLTSTNAYSSLIANGTTKTASEVFGEGAEYFVMYTIDKIDASVASSMVVSVTWTNTDGTTTSSNSRTIDLAALFA